MTFVPYFASHMSKIMKIFFPQNPEEPRGKRKFVPQNLKEPKIGFHIFPKPRGSKESGELETPLMSSAIMHVEHKVHFS